MQISTFIGSKKAFAVYTAVSVGVLMMLLVTLYASAQRTVAEDAEILVQTDPVPAFADVSLTRSGPALVTRGTNLVSMFTVHNGGPAAAQGVLLNVLLPGGMTYVSASAGDCGLNNDIGQVVCTLGTLASGENRTVALTLSVQTIANCQTDQADNSAYASAETQDENIANNLTQDVITVDCPSQPVQQSSSSAAFVPPPPPPPPASSLQVPAEAAAFDVNTFQPQTNTSSSVPQGQPNAGGTTVTTVSSSATSQQPVGVSAPAASSAPAAVISSVPTAAASSAPITAIVTHPPAEGEILFAAPGMTCRIVQSMLRCDMSTPDFSQGGGSIQRSFQSPPAGANGQPFQPFLSQ